MEGVSEIFPNSNRSFKGSNHKESGSEKSEKNVINHFKFNSENGFTRKRKIRLVEAKIEMPESRNQQFENKLHNEVMSKKEKITAKILPSKVNYRLSSLKPAVAAENDLITQTNNEHETTMNRLVRMASIWNRPPLSSSSSNRTPSIGERRTTSTSNLRQSSQQSSNFSRELKEIISIDNKTGGKPKLPMISLETNRLSIQFDSQSNQPLFVSSCYRKRSSLVPPSRGNFFKQSDNNNSVSDYNSLLRRSICIV